MSVLTVYPAAGSGGATCDGNVYRDAIAESFATIKAGAGTGGYSTTSTIFLGYLYGAEGVYTYGELSRAIFTFDTSALTSNANISSAVLSVVGSFKTNDCDSTSIEIVGATPASNGTLVKEDYGQVGMTSFGTKSYASFTEDNSTYNDFTLNSSGIANVSKTGISRFGAALGFDLYGSPGRSPGKSTKFVCLSADKSGTTLDPKLVITYTLVYGPANLKTFNGLDKASVKTINGLAIASVKTINSLA